MDTHKSNEYLIVIIFGLVIGTLILAITGLPSQWLVLGIIGILIPFIAILFGDIKRFFLAILIFSLTIQMDVVLHHTGHRGGPAGFKISLYDIVLLALYVLWLVEISQKKNKKFNFFPEFSVPASGLIGLAFLSLINAQSTTLGIIEITEIFKIFLGFLYIANNIRKKRDIHLIVIVLLLGLFFEAILGIIQYWYGNPISLQILGGRSEMIRQELGSIEISRVSGTFGHANSFGWYLHLMLMIPAALLLFEKRKAYRILYLAILCFGTLAMIFTLSRSSWVAFFIGIFIIAFLTMRQMKSLNRSRLVAFRIILIIIILVPVILIYSNIISQRLTKYDHGSAMTRIPLMHVAFAMIKSHPFLGVGINNYTEVMQKYDPTPERISFTRPNPVHNIYLKIAAEIGIFGFFVLMLIIFRFYKSGLQYIRSHEGYNAALVIGMLGSVSGFLFHGLVDTSYLSSFVFTVFWFFIGILLGIQEIKPD